MGRGSVLVLVEGEREQKFFEKLGSLLPEKTEMTLVPFRCNIYSLYKEMEEYDFDIDVEKAIELSKRVSPEEKEKIKGRAFEAKYLLFDLDLHADSLTEEKRLQAIPKLLEVFDDDSDNGLLFLNYPMFESVREKHDYDGKGPIPTFPFRNGTKYKKEMGERGIPLDPRNLTFHKYCLFLKDSLLISNAILGNPYRMPTKEEAEKINSQTLWEKEKELIDKEQKVYCLNTSVQILLAYFGFQRIKEWIEEAEKSNE